MLHKFLGYEDNVNPEVIHTKNTEFNHDSLGIANEKKNECMVPGQIKRITSVKSSVQSEAEPLQPKQ